MNILQVKNILPSDQRRVTEQAKFTYSLLGIAFEKQIKTIEDQGGKQIKALVEYGKQLVKSSGEKGYSTLLKQKEIFEKLGNGRIGEVQNLYNQINFNNLTYHFKSNSDPKIFIGFKGPLGFYKKIKNCYTTLEKAEENSKRKMGI